jgi:predicted cupin superfamily sugar epimerase
MKPLPPAADLVRRLQLLPHPEGGYYRETYRSAEQVTVACLPSRFSGSRAFSTAIYFLLEPGQFSAFHRIQADEVWHFYSGSPLHVYVIHPNGELETIRLGQDLENGSVLQAVVPAGCWFASRPAGEGFSLVGCTVAPGFDFADFELAEQEVLSRQFPQHQALITSLCRPPEG